MIELLCLFIVAAAHFLPFAKLRYFIQQASIASTSTFGGVELINEELSLPIYLFRCLGGICGEQKMAIETKMAALRHVGNIAETPPLPSSASEDNQIIVMLDYVSRRMFFGDDDNMRKQLQVRVFAYAGVLVILLLIIASALSLLSLLGLGLTFVKRCLPFTQSFSRISTRRTWQPSMIMTIIDGNTSKCIFLIT
jgi:hypothetical protein